MNQHLDLDATPPRRNVGRVSRSIMKIQHVADIVPGERRTAWHFHFFLVSSCVHCALPPEKKRGIEDAIQRTQGPYHDRFHRESESLVSHARRVSRQSLSPIGDIIDPHALNPMIY
jgi:hypothetical protein